MPDETQDLESWQKVIGVKDESQTTGPLAVLKESAAKLLLKVGRSLRLGNRQAGEPGEPVPRATKAVTRMHTVGAR